MIGPDPIPNLPQAQMASGSQRVLRTLLTVGRGKGPSGLLVAPVEYELKVAWVTFQLHQLNTLDKVPVRDVSAWHMVSSFWTPPVSQSPAGTVWDMAWRGKGCREHQPPFWSQLFPNRPG